ncbi:MAG TPA: serine/threonine-protein kinase [Polyangia bacterium]|nr:serine/threonine-protein kinase [Polyangia bacterium]
MSPSPVASPPATEPDVALARGMALGRFVVLGLVGRGAMGEVYGAYDPELDRKIAIKLVRSDGRSDTVEGRTRLMREAQATAKVSHPNVVVVYDAGTFGERVFIAMEFVEGHTLRYWLQEKERPWSEILEVFLAAGRGLAAAHERELVHRDFKPDNVMVSTGGQVRVMDFGLARIVDGKHPSTQGPTARAVVGSPEGAAAAPLDVDATAAVGGPPIGGALASRTTSLAFRDKITMTGSLLGTPAYMSPEQFHGRLADARSDQFSFCVALHEGMFGARPFSGRTFEELAQNVVKGNVVDAPTSKRVPANVRRALERGLRVNPDERFPSMHDLLSEIERGVGSGRGGFAMGATAKLAGVWEAPIAGQPVSTPEKEAIRTAFLATGKAYADATFAGASAVLDRFADRWSEIYVDICEATHVRGEQSAEALDLRMTALMEGLEDLKALCRLLREPTGEVVENAVNAAHALGTLERCQDVALLRAIVRAPEDVATRAAVERLRTRIVNLRAFRRVGRIADGLEAASPLVDEARSVGYGPVLAEALVLDGFLLNEFGRGDAASAAFNEAIWVAELARHDEVAAEAATMLTYLAGYLHGRHEVAEIWSRHTETLLRRMGGHDELWGWYLNDRAAVRAQQGRLVEAIADSHLAVAAKERALGPDAPDVALSVSNLADYLAVQCELDEALPTSQRAVDIVSAALGLAHPLTAVILSNHAELLCHVGRFDEARVAVTQALAVLEPESDPSALSLTYALRTLGLCHLAADRWDEALVVLERAASIRETSGNTPLRLAEVHFPLARAIDEARGDRARAVALANQARREYEQAPKTPLAARDLAELDAWLAAHAPPPLPG